MIGGSSTTRTGPRGKIIRGWERLLASSCYGGLQDTKCEQLKVFPSQALTWLGAMKCKLDFSLFADQR